jgi:catalase
MTVPPRPKRLEAASYSSVNEAYEITWVKYHFKTEQGVEFLTQAEGDEMTAIDGDAHQRDLYTAIEEGDHPSWTLKVQLMPFEDAKTYRFNPFDLTKVWPHGDYPLHEVVLEGVTEPILQRAFEHWRNVDKDLGERIERGVRAGQS